MGDEWRNRKNKHRWNAIIEKKKNHEKRITFKVEILLASYKVNNFVVILMCKWIDMLKSQIILT